MQIRKGRISALRCAIEALEVRQLLAVGDLDFTFGGGDGVAVAAFSGFSFNHDTGGAMAQQSDGKIILAGRSGTGSNSTDRVAVARFNADGILDNTFDGDGIVTYTFADTDIETVAIAPDGKIVVAGRTSFGVVQTWDWFIMRLNPDGSPDASFGGGDGVVTRDGGQNFGEDIHGLAIQSDRKIVVTGVVTQATSQLATARFEEDGDLDPTFSGDGIDVVDFFGGVDYASDVIVDPDGKIVVVGGSVPSGGYRRFILLRYNANGTPDNTFSGDGRATTDFGVSAFAKSVLRDPAGNYIVGGLVGGSGGDMNYAIAKYSSTGALDATFGTNASLPGTTLFGGMYGTTFGLYGIARQADGRILFGGNSQELSTFDSYLGLVRVLDTGAPDPDFGAGGARNYDVPGYEPGFSSGCDVAITSDGKILLAGDGWGNNDTDFAILRVLAEGGSTPPPIVLVGTTLTVTGTSGPDVLTLSANATTFTAILNGQTFSFPATSVASINVDLLGGNDTQSHTTGVPGGTVILGDGNDSLTIGTANKITPQLNVSGGLGDDTVVLAVAAFTPVNFDGGGGVDTFTYNGSQGNDDLVVSDTQIIDEGFFAGSYNNVERVRVLANFSTDIIHLRSTRNGMIFDLEGGDGTDTFDISNPAAPDSFLGVINIIGGPGTDEIRFDDTTNTFNDSYTITPTTFTRDGLATFSYQTVETLRVVAANTTNAISVSPSTTTSIFIDGNNPTTTPGDSVNVSLTGATGTNFTLLGAGRGLYTFTNRRPVEFQEIERDLTPFGPTIKTASFQYQTAHQIRYGFSEVVNGLDVDDITVRNLTTGQTISLLQTYIEWVEGPGIPTTVTWNFSNPLPDGRYEARFAAGSVNDNTGNPLAAEHVLSFFVLTGDLNRDGSVTIADFITLASNFNKTGAVYGEGDVNYDGSVTIADFIDLSSRFGQSLSGSVEPIPMAAASQEALVTPQEERAENQRKKTRRGHHHRLIRKANLLRRPPDVLVRRR